MANQKSFLSCLPLFLVLIIDTMGFALILPVLGPIYFDHSGGILSSDASLALRDLLYGVTLGSFFFFMLFGAPFLGDLSDKIGRKKVLLGCLSLMGVSYFISSIGVEINSVFLLIAGRCLAGLMAGSQPIAQAAIADISTEENMTSNMSLMILANCIGFVVGPMIGGFFSSNQFSWFSHSLPFTIAGILAIANAVILLFSFQETYDNIKSSVKLQLSKGLTLLTAAFKNSQVRMLSLIFLLWQLGWGLYFQYSTLFFAQAYHYTSMQLGWFMAYMGLFFAITLSYGIRVMLRFFDEKQITLISLLLLSLGLCINMLATVPWVNWLAVIPCAMGVGMAYTSMVTLFSHTVGADKQGWIMGITTSIMALSWLLGGLMTSATSYFHLNVLFMLAAVFAIMSSVVLIIYLQVKKQRTATSSS